LDWGPYIPDYGATELVAYADSVVKSAHIPTEGITIGRDTIDRITFAFANYIAPLISTNMQYAYMLIDFAYHGDLEAVIHSMAFIYNDTSHSIIRDQIFRAAVLRSHTNILEWGLSSNATWNSANVTGYAASIGNMHVLNWFADSTDVLISPHAIYNGVIAGHLSVLQFAIERGIELDRKSICDYAVQYSHKHIIRWLLEQKWITRDEVVRTGNILNDT
jgi:hypothetical protein